MTRREWVQRNMPGRVSDVAIGGVTGCPGCMEYSDMPGFDSNIRSNRSGCNKNCSACWSVEIPAKPTVGVDNVNHPAHYELPGGIECFDVLLATQGVEAVKSFCICNAMKYLFRRNRKNGDEDVKKAEWYIAKYIELTKEANANG